MGNCRSLYRVGSGQFVGTGQGVRRQHDAKQLPSEGTDGQLGGVPTVPGSGGQRVGCVNDRPAVQLAAQGIPEVGHVLLRAPRRQDTHRLLGRGCGRQRRRRFQDAGPLAGICGGQDGCANSAQTDGERDGVSPDGEVSRVGLADLAQKVVGPS